MVRVAVGFRLCVPICRPHLCASCGANVEALGAHGLSCRFNKGRHSRHAALNDIVKRTLESVKIPCHLEPSGLFSSDGKRPDGTSIVPWKGGKVLIWDVTFQDTLAPSHLRLAVREAHTYQPSRFLGIIPIFVFQSRAPDFSAKYPEKSSSWQLGHLVGALLLE